MHVNKNNLIPYDMSRLPSKQYWFLMPLIWGGSWLMTRQFKIQIDNSDIKKLKPPYLVIATHQGFSDYYIGPLALFPHRAMYVSDMEGFANFGNWLYRGLGCIPKRRFVSDISVVKNIKYGLSKRQPVVIYPESRHSNAGTTSYIPENMGKLVKAMKVPVVALTAHGSYLANPFWDEEHTRKVPLKVKAEILCTKEELDRISKSELQKRIEGVLQYDEYKYQQDEKIVIKNEKRAEGLHKALYQCRNCNVLYEMKSEGCSLRCNACGSEWTLSEYGWLVDESGSKIHIPDWYEWQRKNAEENVNELCECYDVNVEALPNEHGFVKLGSGKLMLDSDEFILTVQDKQLHFPHKIRESVQTEYNYAGKGMCIVLSTLDCCYYIYCDAKNFNPTRLQFIGEKLFREKNGIE